MTMTQQYLDEVKARLGVESDYEMARVLRVSKQAVSGYRSGKHTMTPSVAVRVARHLEIDPGIILVAMQVDRADQPDERGEWLKVMDRLRSVAVGVIGAVILSGTPGSGNARPGAGLERAHAAAGIHIVARRQRRRSAAAQALARLVDTVVGARVRLA